MGNEKRLIDANALDEKCRRQMAYEWNKRVAPVSWAEAYEEFLVDIWDAPTVDAVEVVHGRWVTTYTVDTWMGISTIDGFVCGECGKSSKVNGNYCPNCGAKMDGDGNGK